jgi:small subunit ribosomal protein S17
MSSERAVRKTAVGVVTRDKMNKTRRVELARLVRHPRYGKILRRRTVCYAHDEKNETRIVRVIARGAGTMADEIAAVEGQT